MELSTTLGPVSQPKTLSVLSEQISESVERGAELIHGGHPLKINGLGNYFEPTVVAEADQRSKIIQEENFGPLVAISKVKNDEEAIQKINDSSLGLTASLWTKKQEHATDLAQHIQVGTVYMNRCDVLDPLLPWCGVKDTGKGASLSYLGFIHLTRPKAYNFKTK